MNFIYKILIIDDEESIRDLLVMILKKESFIVDSAFNGKNALSKFNSFKPDLVLLDIMLPDINGHDMLKELKKIRNTPIIMLTAKDDIVDKVLGLELGAEDYITKPFDTRELVARIKVALRRLSTNEKKQEKKEKILEYNELKINLETQIVTNAGKQVNLTPKEYKLLTILVKNPNRVFSREDLLLKAWGFDYLGDSRAVDICITRLRKKIEQDPSKPKLLNTVYGFGYRFGGE